MSAVLAAAVLPETCPKIENGLTVTQRLLRAARKVVDDLSAKERTSYNRVAQTVEPATTDKLQENEEVELQDIQTSRGSNRDDLDKETKIPEGMTYTRKVILQIISVSLLAFHKVSSDVLVPILLANPAATSDDKMLSLESLGNLNGGFALSTVYIGYFLLTQATIATMAQILVVPRIIAWVGVLRLYRRILLAFPLLYALVPLTIALPKYLAIFNLIVILAVWVILIAIGYTCCSIL